VEAFSLILSPVPITLGHEGIEIVEELVQDP